MELTRSILHAQALKSVLSMTMLLLANENDAHTARRTF
jgi:hypothetical protein